jgi:hypothetical protein
MPRDKSVQALAITVRAAMSRAAEAVNEQDIDGMADGVGVALGVYEQHPAQAHGPLSHLRDLLLWIRAGRSLCATIGRADDDFAALEERAEALRRPLH